MEIDLDIAAKAIVVSQKIEKMLGIIEVAKNLRKIISNDGASESGIAIALGLAGASEELFNDFETTLYMIQDIAEQQAISVGVENIHLIEGFIVMISQLKPRSLRHLEHFISAATDDEWVDGLFTVKGTESEFRCIDRCSDAAKAEFGLK